MADMTFVAPNKIIFQTGSCRNLAEYLNGFSANKVLLITDQGILKAGLVEEAKRSLAESSITFEIFADVAADPAESVIEKACQQARTSQANIIVGLGGGSSLDVAKVVSVLACSENNLSLQDMYGVDAFQANRLPLVLMPTTAGTGSEVTPISIITTGETTKAGIVSACLLPDIALLDANLTLGLPAYVTAATGIDAMVHAIEAFTGKLKKNPLSDMYAIKALSLLSNNIQLATLDGANIQARENMLMGSMLAGQAFANSPVGAVHALAYPLGGHFHIPHGLSNALVLVEVMTFNVEVCAELYAQLAPNIMGEYHPDCDVEEVAVKLISWIRSLIQQLGLPTQLRECGVTKDSLPLLAKEAMQQQRLLVNNPREMTEQDALDIYTKVY